MRLRVRYHRPSDLVADHDQQLSRGGLLVRVDPPKGLSLFQDIELEIACGQGSAIAKSQVIQLMAGVGIAVSVEVTGVSGLAAMVDAARRARDVAGPGPEHSIVEAEAKGAAQAAPTPAPAVGIHARMQAASPAEKIQIALHGTKDERAFILRDTNKTLHPHVLKNPNLQLDEVLSMAKMSTIAPEVLKQIAERREWAQRPEIAIALVRNPKTPAPLAVRLLDHVSPADLRHLAKDPGTRPPIQHAARKKVL